jgi:hypothetical protein
MGKRRPGQRDACALSARCGRLRLGAANGGDAALAARDTLRRLVEIADRTLASDRAAIAMRRARADPRRQQLLRIAIAPADKTDHIERLNLAEQFCAGVGLRAPQRLFEERERFEARSNLLRPVDDFTHADDDRHAVFLRSGAVSSH